MTYSIVARDQRTGELGVAVQSHYFCVGAIVPAVLAGVGAVATQAFAEPAFGPLGIELLKAGKDPAQIVSALAASDGGAPMRQFAVVDAQGRAAAHTGERCIADAGHRTGEGYSVQANMMRRATVPDAMAEAFEAAAGDLVSRLLAALDAAESEGGDIRGRQSAALVVVSGEPTGQPWIDRRFDLRVDDHPDPLVELRRLVGLRRAYSHMDEGDEAMAAGDEAGALERYRSAADTSTDNPELSFWQGVALAAAGKADEARPLLAPAFADHDGWALLLRRLPASGLFPDDPALLDAVLPDP
ncbi:MAG: hypothetical protein QOG03_1205 [Actinomycetota bacterium]|jgi:uncharacterized Ntn-hydrolase superfamily protein|nr:hypothetical protein [Actinomycetota bacterium]